VGKSKIMDLIIGVYIGGMKKGKENCGNQDKIR